jgi:hypothetical protein
MVDGLGSSEEEAKGVHFSMVGRFISVATTFSIIISALGQHFCLVVPARRREDPMLPLGDKKSECVVAVAYDAATADADS